MEAFGSNALVFASEDNLADFEKRLLDHTAPMTAEKRAEAIPLYDEGRAATRRRS